MTGAALVGFRVFQLAASVAVSYALVRAFILTIDRWCHPRPRAALRRSWWRSFLNIKGD
jgi:hypothetical protein